MRTVYSRGYRFFTKKEGWSTVKSMQILGVILLTVLGAALAQTAIGSFRYVKATDPLNDQDRSYLFTSESRDAKRGAQLQLRCQQNSRSKQNDLYIVLQHNLRLPDYYGSYAEVRWQYRFDSKPASSNWLSYFSEDQTRIYLTDEARADFVAQAKKSQRLVIVVTTNGLAPQTFQFNLEQLTEALAKLKCGIQPS